MEATKAPRKHPPIVTRAKAFLQLGLGLTESEAHRTLQFFASSGHVSVAEAAEIVCRFEKSVSRVRGAVEGHG